MIKTIIKNALIDIVELNNIDINSLTIIPVLKNIEGHYCINIIHKYKLNKDIQAKIVHNLEKNRYVKKTSIVNGFINITLFKEYFFNSVQNIINNSIIPDLGKNEKVNVEYCSVNPTGSLHIGHSRNAILGDAIATLLSKVNYNVTKEYYVNDGGNQVKSLAKSVYARYCELNNIDCEFPKNGYVGEEIYEAAKALPANLSEKEIEQFSLNFFLDKIKKDLESLNIKHDVWTYESDIIEKKYIHKAIKIFEEKTYIEYGTLSGKKVEKGEVSKNNLMILKTSLLGDDQDRSLTKSDGSWSYFAPDIGYHLNKIERKFKKMICVLGADHDSYAKRMKIAIQILDESVEYITPLCQLVTFKNYAENMIVKFSKRKGNSITISEFSKVIPKDVIRFMMLEKSCDTQFVFDPGKAMEISNKNPVFYCQYAHSRGCSILKNIKTGTKEITLSEIFDNIDIQNLIISLEQFDLTIHEAVRNLAPYKVINYLKKISENMHRTWQIGKIDPSLRFILDDEIETNTRALIIKAFLKVSKECFELFGITALEKMEQQF